MDTKAFTYPGQCPEVLDQQAMQLSFQVLRSEYPSLALRIRNAVAVSGGSLPLSTAALSTGCVHDIVTALSHRSKNADLTSGTNELVTIRKLLLIWMEHEQQQQSGRGG
jgi:hypothetical protein